MNDLHDAINELQYIKHQQESELAEGRELTLHNIMLYVNGVESTVESKPTAVNALHTILTEELHRAMDQRYERELKEFRAELYRLSEEIYEAGERGEDVPDVSVNIELRGKKISPMFAAQVYHCLQQLVDQELEELEDLP